VPPLDIVSISAYSTAIDIYWFRLITGITIVELETVWKYTTLSTDVDDSVNTNCGAVMDEDDAIDEMMLNSLPFVIISGTTMVIFTIPTDELDIEFAITYIYWTAVKFCVT
jgi:hypothetical protein